MQSTVGNSRCPIRGPGTLSTLRKVSLRVSAHSTANGSAPSDSKAFKTLDIDGVTFVEASQATDYAFQTNPDAVMQSSTVKMLQQKLDQVQDELQEKSSENAELRQNSLNFEKTSRHQASENRDMKEELTTLRTKISKTADDLKAAQQTAASAMQEARLAVTNELSQKYLETRDKQLAKMHQAVKESMSKLEAAEAEAAEKVCAAESSLVDTAIRAAEKVNSEASEAIALSRARVEAAEAAAKSAQEASKRAQQAQNDTVKVAERLFAEASAASEVASTSQTEAAALQEEVARLRGEVAAAIEQRDDGLRRAAERQAHAVRTVRTAHEMCEHRVQEAQNQFEQLKLAERDGARRARDDTDRISRRCAELEERERELMRNQGGLQEALAQLGGRAEAAESKLESRIKEMQAEHDEILAVLKTSSEAALEAYKAESMEDAQRQAQELIMEAEDERTKAAEAMQLEKANFEKLLASVNEELQYWKDRAKRTEDACNTMQSDVLSLARMVPGDSSSMKLAVEGKITRTLIERASSGMGDLVALDDEWLPPLESEK